MGSVWKYLPGAELADQKLGINLMCDLRGGHAEYKLAENCALTQAQGPVSGTNDRLDLGFFGSRLHCTVSIENMA